MRKHPLSNRQKIVLSILLKKLKMEDEKQTSIFYNDIKVLGSDYTDIVFVYFSRISIGESGEGEERKLYWSVDIDGEVNDNAVQTMEFETLSDRVHFFNTLFEIQFNYE
jgi:hypothetical protein